MEEKIDIKAKTIKVDTGKGNTIKATMSYGEQSTLEELLIAYLGQEKQVEVQHNSGCLMIQKGSCDGCDWQKC